MFANGMVMMWVNMLWIGAMGLSIAAGLLACVLGGIRRTRKSSRKFALIAMVVALSPVMVLLAYSDSVSKYGSAEAPTYLILSVIPLAITGLGVWLSRRPPPGVNS